MSKPCRELKRIARENLTGHYGIPMGGLLTTACISLVAILPFSLLQQEKQSLLQTVIFYIAFFLVGLMTSVLSVGMMKLHLSMARKQPYQIRMIFYCFKNHPDRYILTTLLLIAATLGALLPAIAATVFFMITKISAVTVTILVLCALVSFVFVIFITLQFALSFFLMLDHNEMNAFQALHSSRELTKGHRGQLLYIFLSFIGLHLLSLLSFGIGCLWVAPYQSQTFAGFYLDVIGEIPETASSKKNSSAYPTFNQYV